MGDQVSDNLLPGHNVTFPCGIVYICLLHYLRIPFSHGMYKFASRSIFTDILNAHR